MLSEENSESKCIITRSILHFLGLDVKYNDNFKVHELAQHTHRIQGRATYEVMANNLGGLCFDDQAVEEFRRTQPIMAKLLARYLNGVNLHTAHLTWGANHSPDGAVWDINDHESNAKVIKFACEMLQSRVYFGARAAIWNQKLVRPKNSAGLKFKRSKLVARRKQTLQPGGVNHTKAHRDGKNS
jgi:hypothetical protein